MSNKQDINFGDQSLSLGEFDPKQLIYNEKGESINPRIAIIAKSGSGKSVVIRALMHEFYKAGIPAGTVIAPTDRMTKFYQDFAPRSFIYHDYDGSIIARFMKRQSMMIEKNNERIKKGKKGKDVRAYLIMDDCMSTKHLWLKDPLILSIFNEGRHYQIAPFILTMQYSIGIQPELRQNFDFVFMLGEDIMSSKKKLYEHYAGIFPKFELFDQVFSQVTDNYGCLVLNNRLRSSDIKKKVFWYKANEKLPKFMLGCKKVLKYDYKNYDENHEKKQNEEIDVLGFGNRRKTIIKVNKISNKLMV